MLIGKPARTSALSPQTPSNCCCGGRGVADGGQLRVSDSESSECRENMRTNRILCAVLGADEFEPERNFAEFEAEDESEVI